MSYRSLLLAASALALVSGPAFAQDVPAPAPAQTDEAPAPQTPDEAAPEEESTVEDVVVTATQSTVRASIDAVSYSLADDVQAQTGALADALRNIPSVDVDPSGNVSLRGDSNVTILVDGRPSAIFAGQSRANAVLQLPADQYARIEVMTNPSAAYSPEGSGGVINLITKPTAVKPGSVYSGSIRANVGAEGRWNAGANMSWQRDKLTLSGDIGLRHDVGEQNLFRTRETLDEDTGDFLPSRQTQLNSGAFDSGNARFTAEYRLDDKTQLTGELRASRFQINDGVSLETFEAEDASGAVVTRYRRDGSGGFEGSNWGATARVLRQFDDQGHEWSNEIRYDAGSFDIDSLSTLTYLTPAADPTYQRLNNTSESETIGFTSAYVRPLSDDGKLRLGYELKIDRPTQDNAYSIGDAPGALVPVPSATNLFEAEQTVHAAYATYERKFGEKWGVQFGLRAEQANIDVEQVTTGDRASQDYFRLYPTLHAQYQLTENDSLNFSYSRRIQRPDLNQLNPAISYQDPLNLNSGNPDLEPQTTDAFEAAWQHRQGQTFYQATLYYRDTKGAFTDTVTDLGDGVFLTRPENLGASTNTGLELVASGRFTSTLRYNASANIFYQQIDAAGIAGGDDRSATAYSARASLNWQPTDRDFLQVSGFFIGDTLMAQGERQGGGMINLGYRRKLTDKWALQATVRDLLDDFGFTTVYETPTFIDRSERKFGGRMGFIGLTYTFGAVNPRRQEQFDFSGGQQGQ
ncbi:TonB-dependent receptor [Brevundimonas sp. Leaf363]|uniref:outer membrane beta-barrel family protein n=1 Tax=Brevundimonas sp. Leaf363 TaxID=1736353 RepID=UPI0006F34956|nr:outer membrane beta-barrel family protein [Brevundimonas sp. Leaf363]KQS57453.1 TonB-dependent receptor [Brevundimonas sp. Leaf363]